MAEMATSELEQEPDLNKAPPHLEGDLLKQRNIAVLKKGWKKFFFIVIEDHLRYYKKKEDYESGKEPISHMRLSQVKDITEAVFHAVPKKHHLNCGFSLVAFHAKTQEEQTFHLLAENIESKRHWVRGLRYIKTYWSKRKIRETILSEEKERELLERILKEDDDDMEVVDDNFFDEASLDGEEASNKSVSITVHFGHGSKVTTKVSPLDTTSDLLESIKEQLTSSSTQLWLVDQSGADTILEVGDCPAGYLAKAHRFYATHPSQRVLVLFCGENDDFETIVVSSKATARDVVNDADIQVQLDKAGINNSGLFLKTEYEESLFSNQECPSDVLFTLDGNGRVARLNAGRLVLKNKALHSGRKTARVTRSTILIGRTMSSERRELEQISEKEEAEARALDLLLLKKRTLEVPKTSEDKNSGRPATIHDEESIVAQTSEEGRSSESSFPTRARSTAISSGRNSASPQLNRRNRIASATLASSSPSPSSPRHSPHTSPVLSPSHGRAQSTHRLPQAPEEGQRSQKGSGEGQRSPLRRRNASRVGGHRGPTIIVESEPTVAPGNATSVTPKQHRPLSRRTRSPTIRRHTNEPEANGTIFDIVTSGGDDMLEKVTPFQSVKPHPHKTSFEDEDRLEKLFDRTHQLEREEELTGEREMADSLRSKVAASLSAAELSGGGEKTSSEESERVESGIKPMVIDISELPNQAIELPNMTTQSQNGPQPTTTTTLSECGTQPSVPMEIRSPNILKMVLLASEATANETGGRPMDLISLSGVVIKNNRGVWNVVGGSNFHDPLPFDCADHTENFVLPGGVRAIFNHSRTPKRWHVLSPATPSHSTDSRSETDYTEHAQRIVVEDMDNSSIRLNSPQYYRKGIVTEIGAACHDIVTHFEKTRDMEEKKRIGSDMINSGMGYTVRGRFCSALASLLLEGLRPYRIQRLILNDIWKVTSTFCQEVQVSDASLFLPHELDKLAQIMLAIGSLRALKDHNMKFRTFVCLCLSRGLLCKWLQMLPDLRDTLGKFYQPHSFLVLASDQSWNQTLYNNMLRDLEPLDFLPFDLSIDFESKQDRLVAFNETKNYSRIPTPSSSPHPSPHPSPHTSPPVSPSDSPQIPHKFTNSPLPTTSPKRPSVTVIKNAATGQRTNTNLITAVWEPPNDKEDELDPLYGREGEGGRYGGGVIEEPDIVTHVTELERERGREREVERERVRERETVRERGREREAAARERVGRREGERGRVGGEVRRGSREADIGTGGLGRAVSLLRKMASSLQNISSIGLDTQEQPKQQITQPHPTQRHVKALYANLAEDADELSFSQGDIMSVTGSINKDWLICSLGPKTGIVPANFVQEV